MGPRLRRQSLARNGSTGGSGSFYGYIGDLRNAFDPHSGLLKSWHQVLFSCMLYQAFLLPFAVTFGLQDGLPPSTVAFRAFYITEALFCADFYVRLNTGFYEAGNIHRDRRKVRAKYMKSIGFFLDVLAILPMSIILPATGMIDTTRLPESFRPGWLEVHKALRIWRVPGYLSNLDDVYAKRFRALKSIKVLVVMALVTHLVACGRFEFGWQSSASQDLSDWLPPNTLRNETLGTRYVRVSFWSVGIMTGAFEGALPHANVQFAFTLAVALMGLILFTYAYSTLFMLSKSESSQAVLAHARINQLRHLLTFHHVPESLQDEAVEYLQRHYTDAESNDRDVVKLLCPSIAKDIQVELLKDMVGRIPLFRGCNEQFIVALTSLLEMASYPAHVTLFQAGDEGDYMYVVNSGILHIMVNGVKVRELRQGSFFGEVSVFSKWPRSAAVVTTSYCTLYRLSRFHTERVLEGYPDDAPLIAAAINEMVSEREVKSGEGTCGEEFMLTTLYQLSTKSPIRKQRKSLRDRARKATLGTLHRSKSAKVLSASRHSEYDGGNISMSENRAITFSPGPIRLPANVPPKTNKGKLVRSHSAYARRISTGINWWPQRAASLKSSAGTRQDTMQGFYDNLARRRGSQQLGGNTLSTFLSRMLLRRAIDHTSQWRKYWLILLHMHLAANWYIIPLFLAFPVLDCPGNNQRVKTTYVMLDVLLGIDMYMNFHLSYNANRKKIMQPSLTAKHYLCSFFIADLLCMLPYRWIIPVSSTSVLAMHPALFRLPRLLRAWRIKGHIKEWGNSFPLSNTSWLLIALFAYLMLLHLVACVYFSVTYVEGFGTGDSWLSSSEVEMRRYVNPSDGGTYFTSPANSSCSESDAHAVAGVQYARALYFGATMLTGLGKTVEPASVLQYLVTVLLMVCGFLSMAVVIDIVQKRVTASAFEQKEFLVTRTHVQKFLHSRTAPAGVHQRVKSFLEFWWSSHRGAIASDLLNELPEAIKRPVLRSMCQPALQTLSLLEGVRTSLGALEEVFIDNIRFILYGQGEIIYRQGDYANGIFFLLEGELIIIANGGSPRTLVKGGFIGTAALNLNEASVSYEERVTAASGCILLFISREYFNGMHKIFPTFSMALRALEKRLDGSKLARVQQEYSVREQTFSGDQQPILPKILTLETKILRYLGFDGIVFDPDSTGTEVWELLVFCLIVVQYLKVVGDITTGADQDIALGSELLSVLIEICFWFDLFFHSRLGFYEYGNKRMDVVVIRKTFFRSRQCWYDVIALIPLYFVNWVAKSTRHYEILSVNKLLRLVRASEMFMKLESKHLNHTLQLRLLKLVFVSIMLAHLFGCVWFNFSGSSSWMPSQSLQRADIKKQYSASLFWSFGLMSNSFAGELPKTVNQCCFSVVVLLSGGFLFAFVVGNISDVLELVDANSRDFNKKLGSLRLLLSHFNLPVPINEQLKTFFFFQRYHTITQEYLLERCLPPSLLTEIRLVHLQPMIVKVGFLSGMEGSVTRMLVSHFVQALTVKNQFVFRLGEEGSDMFFVFTGIIEVLVPLETIHRRQSQDAKLHSLGSPSRSSFHTFFPTLDPSKLQARGQLKKVNELTSGSYFGEVALFTSKPRSAHARCKTSCVLYRLSRRSLELVFERYPDWKRKVLKIVNIQQEQQLLRNMYMEEQMDIAENTSKKMLIHVDILGDAVTFNRNNRSGSSASSMSERFTSSTRKTSTRPFGGMKSGGPIFSSYKAQRLASAEETTKVLTKKQKENVLWVDRVLQCTNAQSRFHLQWLMLIAAGTVYMALIIPFRNSFDALERLGPLPIAARAVELTCEVLFGWDIWVNWNLKDSLESMELYESKQRDAYQRKRLWIDVIAAIPVDHFLSDFYQSPLLCLNRCLKLFNFPHYMREINRRSVAYEQNRMCTLWILLFVLMHWCACAYFSLASTTSNKENVQDWDYWAPPRAEVNISWDDPPLDFLIRRFFRGIFFASTAFIKKGKVFEPTGYNEYMFTLVMDFIGMVTLAFMIGEMANLYVSYVSNEVEFRKNHIAVNLYLERWHITGRLRARSHAFLSSLWSSHRGVNYQAIFDEIPQVIRTESIMHIANLPLRVFINNVFRPFATTHPHDRDLEALTRAIAQQLKYEGYPRDECVVVEGSVSNDMFFVVKGYLISTRNDEQPQDPTQQPGKHYKKGDFFGEHGLLGYSVGISTVKTVSACDLLSLSSESLLKAILSRPLFQTALSIAVEGYRELFKRTRLKEMFQEKKYDASSENGDWGLVLFQILESRRKQWSDEALAYREGNDEDPFNEPWTVSSLRPGQEVGLVTISSPTECVKVFELLLRLITTRGLLDTRNLYESVPLYQETSPIVNANLSNQRSNMSVTERSDSSRISGNKLSYLH